jgi:hypothetical protein
VTRPLTRRQGLPPWFLQVSTSSERAAGADWRQSLTRAVRQRPRHITPKAVEPIQFSPSEDAVRSAGITAAGTRARRSRAGRRSWPRRPMVHRGATLTLLARLDPRGGGSAPRAWCPAPGLRPQGHQALRYVPRKLRLRAGRSGRRARRAGRFSAAALLLRRIAPDIRVSRTCRLARLGGRAYARARLRSPVGRAAASLPRQARQPQSAGWPHPSPSGLQMHARAVGEACRLRRQRTAARSL